MEIFKNSKCFSFLTDDDKSFLENKKTHVNFLSSETIFKQGALNTNIFFVISGYVKLYVELGKYKRINIFLAQSGDFISLSALFNDDKYKLSATALTDATLCILDKNSILEILKRNHNFLLHITQRAFESENRFIEVIKNISYKQMRGKLASALLYLTNEMNFDKDITHLISRQDLADFSGITVENTVTLLKEFERDGIILLEGKSIKVLDSDTLFQISIKG